MRRIAFRSQSPASALLDIFGERLHGFLRDRSALATRERHFCLVERRQDLQPSALTLFLERQGLLHGLFLVAEPAAFDGPFHERALVRRQVNAHTFTVDVQVQAVNKQAVHLSGPIEVLVAGGDILVTNFDRPIGRIASRRSVQQRLVCRSRGTRGLLISEDSTQR